MSRPILAVIGATGAQGRGLARTALADPQQRFAGRALNRTLMTFDRWLDRHRSELPIAPRANRA